jgi:hypothetical protein
MIQPSPSSFSSRRRHPKRAPAAARCLAATMLCKSSLLACWKMLSQQPGQVRGTIALQRIPGGMMSCAHLANS